MLELLAQSGDGVLEVGDLEVHHAALRREPLDLLELLPLRLGRLLQV